MSSKKDSNDTEKWSRQTAVETTFRMSELFEWIRIYLRKFIRLQAQNRQLQLLPLPLRHLPVQHPDRFRQQPRCPLRP